MNLWKKVWNFILIVALLIGFIPIPANIQPARANPEGDNFLYLPLVASPLPTIIPESTNILTDQSNQYLISISPDIVQFVFSQATSELDRVKPGDIIVSGISINVPNGYLRKVLTKQSINGQVVLTTEPAALEEAIQQASASFTYDFSPADIVDADMLPGVTLAIQESFAPNFDVLSLQLNQVMLDGNLVASGSFTLDLSLDFDFKIKFFSLEKVSLALRGTETTNLQLVSTYEAAGNEEYEIGSFRLRPVSFIVGGFPIIVQPTIVVMLGVDGSVSASLTAGLTQVASLEGGVQYADGDLSPVKDFSNNFTIQEPAISAEMEAKAYTGVGLELAFYTTSPLLPELALNVRAGPRLQADESLCWVLKGFLEVELQARLKFLSWDLEEVNTTLANIETLLLQGQKCKLLDIHTHHLTARSNADAFYIPGPISDYQWDYKEYIPVEEDLTLETSISAIAGGVETHTTSNGSLELKTGTNSLGVPNILGAEITYETSWDYNPNGIPYSVVGGFTNGLYVISLTNNVKGDYVFNYSSEVNRSKAEDVKGGTISWWTGGVSHSYELLLNTSGVITTSVTAGSTLTIHFYPFEGHFRYQSLEHPLSGSGTTKTNFQWKFVPGGAP